MIYSKTFESHSISKVSDRYNRWILGDYKKDELFQGYEDNVPDLVVIQLVKELSKTEHFLTVFFKIKEKKKCQK